MQAAGGDMLLAAGGLWSDVVLNADAVAGANLSVLAAETVVQNADLTAGGTIDVEAFAGSVTMLDGTVSQTAGGNIRYAAESAGQDVVLGLLDANNGAVSVVAANAIRDAGQDRVGHDEEGWATQMQNARTENIRGNQVRLEAGGDVGMAGNPIDVAAGMLAATAGGAVYIYETDALNLGTLDPVTVPGLGWTPR
jgi:hypothetical protein